MTGYTEVFDLNCRLQGKSRFQPGQLDLILGDYALVEIGVSAAIATNNEFNRLDGARVCTATADAWLKALSDVCRRHQIGTSLA
jgi:hypothetical protein